MQRITIKVNGKGEIIPTSNYDKQYLLQNVKIDEVYSCKITKGRSYKSLGLYWLICQGMAFHFKGNSEMWHWCFKNTLLPKQEIYNPLTKQKELHVSSINFEKMDELSFKKYLNEVIELLIEKGIDYNILINTN